MVEDMFIFWHIVPVNQEMVMTRHYHEVVNGDQLY